MKWRDRVGRMPSLRSRVQRTLPPVIGALALLSVGVLLICDASPRLFPANVHDTLATLPLVLTAIAVLFQAIRRARPVEWAKALVLALAFFFWAASQIWVQRETAMLFNDVAVALFVLDVVLVIAGRPAETTPRSAPGY
jgi:hypothetical protein